MTAEPYGANYDTYQDAYNRNLDISVELENEIKALETSGSGSAAGTGMGGGTTGESWGEAFGSAAGMGMGGGLLYTQDDQKTISEISNEIINSPEYQKQVEEYAIQIEEGQFINGLTGSIAGLSYSEAALSAGFPSSALAVNNNKDIAEKCTQDYYGELWFDDIIEANAFKHAYWQALNSRSMNPDLALSFAFAHEYKEENDTSKEYLDTTTYINATNMDLYNNAVGIAIGIAAGNDVTNEQLAEIVYEVVVNQGQGIWKGHGLDGEDR